MWWLKLKVVLRNSYRWCKNQFKLWLMTFGFVIVWLLEVIALQTNPYNADKMSEGARTMSTHPVFLRIFMFWSWETCLKNEQQWVHLIMGKIFIIFLDVLSNQANVSKSTAKKHTKLVLLAGSCVDRVSWQFCKISWWKFLGV